MHYAIVRDSDLSIQGTYEAESIRHMEDGFTTVAVHPSLIGSPMKAVRSQGAVAVVAEPRELTLEERRAAKLKRFDEETKAFILARYQIERQTTFILLLTTALFEGKMNRAGYVQQAVLYVNDVLAYHFGINAQIEGAFDDTGLDAVTWDFAPLVDADPRTSIETALGIMD